MCLPRSNHRFGGNGASISYIRRSGTPNNLFITNPEPFKRDVGPYYNGLMASYLRGKLRTAHVSKYATS